MSEALLTSYEEIPYESKPLYPTHPDCIGALATLMGMKPAPVNRCRALELGCASGGNLIPMAEALPESSFLGVDLSPSQIQGGRKIVETLGLGNIDLRAMSILDLDDSYGKFDYIFCHGVYSWVPPEVQDKILSICSRNLAANGIAYISYNTLPGWHRRAAVREMMSYHVKQFTEPMTRVEQARAFLNFLISATPNPEGTYHRVLTDEAELLRPAADSYIFHEHLEDVNYPIYFSQFMERAQAKGLQFLGESWYHTRLDKLSPDAQRALQDLSDDIIQLEQYYDFLTNRTFRRTVLCHRNVALTRTPPADVLNAFSLTAMARPVSAAPDLDSTAVEKFTLENGTSASTNVPIVKAALTVLYEAWPRSLPFRALWSAVQGRLPSLARQGPRALELGPALLTDAMLRSYLSNFVALHIHVPDFVVAVSARPQVTPLARLQAATQTLITNRRHRLVELDDLDRAVVRHLDGTRDRAALVDVLVGLVATNELVLRQGEDTVEDAEKRRELLSEVLEARLGRLARNALLVA